MNFILDIVEDKISELEDGSEEFIQHIAQIQRDTRSKRKQFKQQENKLSDSKIYLIGFTEKENKMAENSIKDLKSGIIPELKGNSNIQQDADFCIN